MPNQRNVYIIARTMRVTGIGAMYVCAASHSLYAISKGYVPIMDLKHNKNQYFKTRRTFRDNTWEYFFEQPGGITLDDITEQDNIIISENEFMPHEMGGVETISLFDIPDDKITPVSMTHECTRKQVREMIAFKPDILRYVQAKFDDIIGKDTNILGVLARGTDYAIRKTPHEARQPSVETMIKKVRQYLKKHPEITKIYLATEDNDILQTFRAEFGDRLITIDQYRYTYDKKSKPFLSEIETGIENHHIQIARDYLASLYILSKCKYFVGGRCNGTLLSYIWQTSWQDWYIWNLGIYRDHMFKIFIKKLFSVDRVKTGDVSTHAVTVFGKKYIIKNNKAN